MKHLLLLLVSFVLTASVNVAAAMPTSEQPAVVMHSALVDMPKVIDLSRADPTTWPVPPASPTLPASKGWRYLEEYRMADANRARQLIFTEQAGASHARP